MNDFETTGLVERAKAIILQPDATWPKIAAEQASSGDILTRYVLPLAAIGPIASFIGGQLFGITLLFATISPSLMSGLTMAVTSFVMSLIALVILTFITDFLAPNFGGQSDRAQAFKLVAYSMTPGWVAAGLGIIPSLSLIAGLIGLYGLYLLYKGATPLMKIPQEKAGLFTAVAVVCAIVLNIITGTVIGTVTGALGVGAASIAASSSSGDQVEVNIPGVGKIDSAKMEEAAKGLEGLANGKAPKPVDLAALQALLPTAIGAYQRTSIESTGVGGIGATAEATYKNADKTIRVKIVDLGGIGTVAGVLGGIGVEQNREDADGYERTRTVDGKIQTEKWNTKRSSGSFGTQVAGRFMVEADGEAGSIDELKAIVAGIDPGKLEALAK
jgi:hypothetical protein